MNALDLFNRSHNSILRMEALCQGVRKGQHVKAEMGTVNQHRPVLLVLAAFSRYEAAIDWGRQMAEEAWGPVALASPLFSFDETDFYAKEMGGSLKKTFFAFEQLIDPASLVDLKHLTNRWEAQCAEETDWPEPRPLNLDPGYVSPAKLILATTKDRDHRIYLDRGIYAECTLFYQHGAWRPREWTYPDYRRAEYHKFFNQCREYLRRRQKN